MEEQEKEAYGIAAALSEALEAAVFADTTASYKACDLIERFAYNDIDTEEDTGSSASMNPGNNNDSEDEEREKELAMAKFTMKDSNGQSREISIPLITMIPLPLLHVTEANFDITMKVEIEDGDTTTTSSSSSSTVAAFTPQTSIRRKMGLVKREAIIPSASRLTGRRMVVRGTTSDSNTNTNSSSKSTTVDVHMTVKMEQAEIPEGIKLMLQAAANSIQSTAAELNNQQ